MRRWLFVVSVFLLLGCGTLAVRQLDVQYGTAGPARFDVPQTAGSIDFASQVQPILDMRCVACHACFDASCQLKLNSYDGITRGLSQEQVYDATRLVAAQPTRLFEDAHTTAQWRDMGFAPVLNERSQNPDAHIADSLIAQSLLLKTANPLPGDTLLDESFSLGLGRDQQCKSIEHYDEIKRDYPLWGMPYGLPGLSGEEQRILLQWLVEGAPRQSDPAAAISASVIEQLADWEAFLNRDDLKSRLMARYIFEHLFPASLYFADPDSPPVFFRLVRSATPPGTPLQLISTRLPFSDPGVSRVYYRFLPINESVVRKSHMPYALDDARLANWKSLFVDPDYEVTSLPSYELASASNPFVTFAMLPAQSRYRFMLEEAQYTVMAYIKGPVCRGQTAVDVINDHFWVFFSDPEVNFAGAYDRQLEAVLQRIELPAEAGSTSWVSDWMAYAGQEQAYLEAKTAWAQTSPAPGLQSIWAGDGANPNAALTVFRHNDNAEVVKGLQGDRPQTAWVVNYPLLERIHYLLVAGYDVFGNVGHQLNTRIYMDFLRIEGESNFLSLLPADAREKTLKRWYRDDVSHRTKVLQAHGASHAATGVSFQSETPLDELYRRIAEHVSSVHDPAVDLELASLSPDAMMFMQRLASIGGVVASRFPEFSVMMLKNQQAGTNGYFSILRNRAFTNISHLVGDEDRRLPEEDSLSVHPGFLGSYPNVYLEIDVEHLQAFVEQAEQLAADADFAALLDQYGVRRTDPEFWSFSDEVQTAARQDPIAGGLLDYNRLENR